MTATADRTEITPGVETAETLAAELQATRDAIPARHAEIAEWRTALESSAWADARSYGMCAVADQFLMRNGLRGRPRNFDVLTYRDVQVTVRQYQSVRVPNMHSAEEAQAAVRESKLLPDGWQVDRYGEVHDETASPVRFTAEA